jgi:hypothetical protein
MADWHRLPRLEGEERQPEAEGERLPHRRSSCASLPAPPHNWDRALIRVEAHPGTSGTERPIPPPPSALARLQGARHSR